jgi:hypothetical protein
MSSVEYLLNQYQGDGKPNLNKQFERAKKLNTQGNYYQARMILDELLERLGK